ncbi:unnamed protein product [Adineta steineri]|uniref:F-box domain-containing protein n=1 Tax=Adineta steineri TaxID=433720 RepID=A0A818UD02_9BILA|nr:unnamed protein product [Adineta steineri]
MKLEDLPGELWFAILSYLPPLDAFYAFNNTDNARIHSILTDMYLIRRDEDNCSSIINISLAHIPLLMYNFAVSNVISFYSNIIHSLTLSNDQTPDQINSFLVKYSFKYDFTYLKCLHLIEPSSNEFNLIINDLSNITMLNIQSKQMHSFDINTIQQILYNKPTIKHCCLSQFRQDFILNNSYSFIQKLNINSCDYLCFINILNHFYLLEKLSINILSMSRNAVLSSIDLIQNPVLIKNLKIRAFSIPFDYFQILFPYLENIQIFSFAIVCDEGFDYVNNDKWQMIISNYWPLLKKFHIYSELWHLTPIDFDELCPQLFSFRNDSFWSELSTRWGYPIDTVHSLKNTKYSSITENTYQYVNRLLLTVYNNKQMKYELDKSSRYFPNIDTLTVRFEQSISSALFGLYINKIINLSYIKHLALNDKFHNMSTLYELVLRLPNMTKLTITSNHRILIKQIFQRKNERLLSLLSCRLLHFNLLYDGVISYEIIQSVQFNFPHLKSFSACLPHFEDFRDAIPSFIRHMKSLQYLHIGLEGDNDKKNFLTQDMYDWFRRHQIFQEFKLSVDTYTNSIHIWL